ncbi:hypothetical protein K491DRAFT_259671 [Lophiostoma macrostomum CBS 122681]|uniref:Uncharacterized protein n=1 Tax=Lophiostoma macrostomum CBS 122681 TaxID=1314788 RepID=A0A6A6TI20_9PLEO|nr:hypothetical protein K491DRAFT_259671 [Lophiostoma macrostomum CBS 122681]
MPWGALSLGERASSRALEAQRAGSSSSRLTAGACEHAVRGSSSHPSASLSAVPVSTPPRALPAGAPLARALASPLRPRQSRRWQTQRGPGRHTESPFAVRGLAACGWLPELQAKSCPGPGLELWQPSSMPCASSRRRLPAIMRGSIHQGDGGFLSSSPNETSK